ncbi:PREDICTED: probable ascorbate-specific transmembrane electron transporter 1 [Ipomoea nil]|uniref:probable ascorbate-specific transmembrane electron transporter 1 n=1 Tax=Ipomoea nil TaxID=35883 RepID=UPI000900C7FD|nr:PREDICTED: probable ascorbate-specific transmembrane electron transporter 1 [Ipomoea nil]
MGMRIASVLAHLLFIAITTLVLIWLLRFREGLSFNSANNFKIFNLHPLFMVVGFVLISGEAILVYTTPMRLGYLMSKRLKALHISLHLIALGAAIVGLYVVFKFHHDTGTSNLVSLHSWIGISTVALFALQWVFSFFTFLFPSSRSSSKAPWHALFGLIIFSMGILSAVTGLLEKFISLDLKRDQEGLIVNFIGLLLLLFGISVGLTVLLPRGYLLEI